MKRTLTFVLMLLAVAGCRRAIGGPEPGAAASQVAIQNFLNAAKGGDIQAMSAMFGNDVSPLRDRAGREEVERRMLIMACHLKHDTARIGAAQPGQNGRTTHRVELTLGTKAASPQFTTVRNARTGRWFVEEFDLPAVRDFCTAPGAPDDSQPLAGAH